MLHGRKRWKPDESNFFTNMLLSRIGLLSRSAKQSVHLNFDSYMIDKDLLLHSFISRSSVSFTQEKLN